MVENIRMNKDDHGAAVTTDALRNLQRLRKPVPHLGQRLIFDGHGKLKHLKLTIDEAIVI